MGCGLHCSETILTSYNRNRSTNVETIPQLLCKNFKREELKCMPRFPYFTASNCLNKGFYIYMLVFSPHASFFLGILLQITTHGDRCHVQPL